jgi:Domain of unknown function (DU1801)
MAELKTKKTAESVPAFLAKMDEAVRKDCKTLVALMENATGAKARMWGTSIVGFGEHLLRYDSGRELDWFVMGFSPRKAALTLYLPGYLSKYEDLLSKLGKYKTGKGCLYIRRLEDVDAGVLKKLIRASSKI